MAKIQLPEGWVKVSRSKIEHVSGRASVELGGAHAYLRYNPRCFLVRVNGDWIYDYQMRKNGGGWIAEFKTLLDGIREAEKRMEA
jgi:hypothetical protein